MDACLVGMDAGGLLCYCPVEWIFGTLSSDTPFP